jgi:hypothetical protein
MRFHRERPVRGAIPESRTIRCESEVIDFDEFTVMAGCQSFLRRSRFATGWRASLNGIGFYIF